MIAFVVTLAGCTAPVDVESPAPGVSTPPTAEQTPSPTPTIDPAARPAQLFDGDCDRLLPLASARDILDSPVTLQEPTLPAWYTPPSSKLLGEISCTWSSGDENAGHSASVRAIFDTGAMTPDPDIAFYYGPAWLEFSASGILFEVTTTLGSSEEQNDNETRQIAGNVLGAFKAKLQTAALDEPAKMWVGMPTGSWDDASVDCAELQTAADVDGILGEEVVGEQTVIGRDESGEPFSIIDDAANIEVHNIDCYWHSSLAEDGPEFRAELWPGQGFTVDDADTLGTVQTVEIAGADAAYFVTVDDSPEPILVVQSGVNRLNLRGTLHLEKGVVAHAAEQILVVLN